MRRSDTLIKAISVILLIAIVCYMGFHLADSFLNPLQTTLAVNSRVTSSAQVSGYVIRQEMALTANGILSPAENGKKVAAGGVVAINYNSSDALARADRILEIDTRIEHLEGIIEGHTSGSAADTLIALSGAVNHHDLTDLDAVLYDAEYAIMGIGSEDNDPNTELETLKDERKDLTTYNLGYSYIYARKSGIFSSWADGFEHVTPDDLTGLTPASLENLFSSPQKSDNAFGKLITGTAWYFAAVMDASDAENLSAGEKAKIEFSKNYSGELSMKVESISAPVNGKCVVVFSGDTAMTDICNVREMTGEVIFSSQTGILTPKDAVYTDEDGSLYIYVLMGLQSQRVDIEIVCDYSDYYYLIKAADGETLNEGAEIIVRGKNLFDGKVVK
ncbi:MAG: hypothetical protein IJ017_01445 [Oscillospiraceae bacterium]|nr:hypothetical protein [Oscillospiraceae bacterium]